MLLLKTCLRLRQSWRVAMLCCGAGLLVGCQTDLFEAQRAYRAGDLRRASDQITGYRQQVGENQHAVIALLESGSILQAAGDLEGSLAALEDAERRFDRLDDDQAARAGDEVISAATSPQEVVYVGKPYDRVMAPVYRAINLMALGRTQAARQALFTSQQWQDRAVSAYRQQIEDAEAELNESQQNQARRVQDDPNYSSVSKIFTGIWTPFGLTTVLVTPLRICYLPFIYWARLKIVATGSWPAITYAGWRG